MKKSNELIAKRLNFKTIKRGQIIILEGRVYRVEFNKWDNGRATGERPFLKIVREPELIELLLKATV